MVKIVEEYVVSLLGAEDKPVPTIWHLQKEFFILTKMNPKAQQLFNFVKHYEGPYSQVLQDSFKEPMYYEDAFTTQHNGEICLTNQGKKAFKDIKSKYTTDERFTHLLHSLKLIRDIYDKLTKEELLFLIYVTYPEYVEFSNIYDRLVKNQEKREQLSRNLLKKGLITLERYKELISLVAK
jgi:Mn-dependent DtxR family transcriptional regulator